MISYDILIFFSFLIINDIWVMRLSVETLRTVLAYKTWFCLFSVYRNRFIMFWSYFFVLKLGVHVRLVKSLFIVSFYY